VISSAAVEDSLLRIVGTLQSSPSSNFTFEFFASPACDASGFGEGEVFLGAGPVSTGVGGEVDFEILLPATLPAGWVVTATATLEPVGATSEFSACIPITGSASQWTDFGQGLAGAVGIPSLVGTGELTAGSAGTLVLTNAAPLAPAIVFMSLSSTPSNFKCGTLVPVPAALQLLSTTSGAGSIPFSWASWPGGLFGVSLWFQYAIADAAAACGVSISNALRADVP
jgi:hypothetical protein